MRRFLIAVVLCAITAVSGAWTLQWNTDSSWPAGTTVSACLNGVCVNGITGNSQSFSETYQPGTVLHGTAQAVPPVGYQCGDPLADCPPSAIAEIAQTIPSDQSQPSRSAWAAGSNGMAIAYIGSTSIQASSGSVSQAVTVPTGTNYAVIFYGGWSSTVRTVTSISLGGTSASNLYTRANSDDAQDSYVYGVATSEGSKTLALTMSGAMTEGGIVQIAFLSGVDTSNPLVATNFAETTSSALSGATWTNMASAADGIGLVFATGYAADVIFTITAQSQTQMLNGTYNSDDYVAGYKLTTAATTTFGITVDENQRYWSAVVVTLRPSSGAQTHNYTGSGGIATGGAAALKRTWTSTANGGITTGGAASASKSSGNNYTASGGITIGGAAALKRTQATASTGGVTTGGAAALKRTQATASTGGIVTGGAATASKSSPGQNSYTASGGVTTGGAATLKRTQTAVGAGGIATGGAATLKRSFARLASGGLSTGGVALFKQVHAYLASGGLTTDGAAFVTFAAGAFIHIASGGVSLGGSASVPTWLRYAASGGLTVGGSSLAGYYPISRILPSGRLVVLSKSDRHIVLQRSDRLISLLPSDRLIIPA